ncbi:hypothetical protein B0T22DRAFT_358847, partial [Podospora appendiculata]
SSSNAEFAGKLDTLLQTTSTAAREITRFFQDAKIASERLQRQISLGNLTQIQSLGILRMTESRSKETHALLKKLADSQTASASNLEQSTNEISSHLVKLFPLKAYLEEWIRRIVDYCNEIIDMVQRNTHTLLSLHQMMVKLEAAVQRAGIDLPILELEDPFGIRVPLAFQFCNTWKGLCRMLDAMYIGKPGFDLVKDRQFFILHAQTHKIIAPGAWSDAVVPGDRLAMSIALSLPRTETRCPWCGALF